MKIKNRKLINYLCEKGVYPKKQNDYFAYYEKSEKLTRLVDSYYIESVCFCNW